MRLLLFLFLLPALAQAQPATIPPEQIIGFIRTDLNNDSYDERAVLVLDEDGVIDLYIFDERSGELAAYVPYFSATTRYPPILYYAEDNTLGMSLYATSGLGSHEIITWVGHVNGGYYITSITISQTDLTGDSTLLCEYDFLKGKVRITHPSGEVFESTTNTAPLPLDGNIPDSLHALCEY